MDQRIASGGIFKLGGDIPVYRIGYGAMQLSGPGVWGPPADIPNAIAVLRRARELGVNLFDTADVYGPDSNERLINEALSPYPPGLVIATKGGLVRAGPGTRENPNFSTNGNADHIRRAVEGSLKKLGVERIDLYQLHRIDPAVPVEDTMRTLRELQNEGKIRHIGLSEVGVSEIERARSVVDIVSVQNIYNLAIRKHEGVLSYCERHGIAFIPFWPLSSGDLARSDRLREIAGRHDASTAQIALAWLLSRSKAILLIPGTSSLVHLEENVGACEIRLSQEEMRRLDAYAEPS